jgi:AcrR family transcriptional regulator
MTDAEIVKRQILDAAYEVFTERGYQGTSTKEVALKAGVKPTVVRGYYQDKRGLLSSIIDDIIGALDQALADESPSASSTIEEYVTQISRMGLKLFSFFVDHPYGPKILFYESLGIDEEIAMRVQASFDVVVMYTEGFLRHGINKGFVREDVNARETAVLVNTMFFEIARRVSREQNPEQSYQRWTETVTSLLFGGLLAPRFRGVQP